ncbi:Cyclin-dependent kinase G-1 [Sesamum alatum]|uniref:Cyclin-dependent kinase G-1 n=1 Tax=Sesamum alatum TaxID=300844 RepID=A0AAE2CHW6_9LAMI|nr:Cyclin-dependent kinase G-1 [Sesamum alatum]
MAFGTLYACNKNDHHPHLYKVNRSQYEILGRADHYEYLNVISLRYYDVVYRPLNKKIGEVVAMKHEFYELCKSTLSEIHVLKSLSRHQSIVEFEEVVVDDCDRVFVVIEHLVNNFKRLMDMKILSMHPSELKCMMKAPEVLLGAKAYSSAIDMWFLAATAFGGCPMLTQLGFDLLSMLLCFDLDKRITADEALNHGWFKEFDPYFLWFSKTHQQST